MGHPASFDRRQAEQQARRFARAAVPLLTAAFALATLGQGARANWVTQVTAVFILSAAWIPLLAEMQQRIFDPFNPRNLFLLSFGLQFGLYPLFVLNGGARLPLFGFAAGSGSERHYVGSQWLATLGLLAYLAGYGNRLARRLETLLPRPRPLDPARVARASRFLFVAGYLGAFGIFFKEGGISQFLANREQWRAGGMSGSGLLLMAAWLWLPLAAILPLLAHMLDGEKDGERRGKQMARFALLAVCLIPVYLLGFRTLILTPVLECVAIRHYLRRRVKLGRIAAVGLMLAGLMTVYGLSRNDAQLNLNLIETLGPQAVLDYLLFRTPGTDTVATILANPQSAHFEYGITSGIEAATILVPRDLWPGKPVSWGEQSTTRYFADYLLMTGNIRDTYGGINPTAIGYLYLQLGAVGVAVGMFLIGAVSRTIYLYGLRYAGPNSAFFLFILLWPLPIMVAEGPQNALNQLVIIVTCAWLPLSRWAAPKGHTQART